MEENIAGTLGVAKDMINIKATTEEGLGFTGTEAGMAAQAICSLEGIYEMSVPVGNPESGCAGCSGCKRDREDA